MKTLNIPLENKDYEKINTIKEKCGKSWRDFIIAASEAYEKEIKK